jgi:hypothetical protein
MCVLSVVVAARNARGPGLVIVLLARSHVAESSRVAGVHFGQATRLLLLLYAIFRLFAGVVFDIPYALNCNSSSSSPPSEGFLCGLHHSAIASPTLDAYFTADLVLASRSLEMRVIVGFCGALSILLFVCVVFVAPRRSALLAILSLFQSQMVVIFSLWFTTHRSSWSAAFSTVWICCSFLACSSASFHFRPNVVTGGVLPRMHELRRLALTGSCRQKRSHAFSRHRHGQ